jgi:hypothetical protein
MNYEFVGHPIVINRVPQKPRKLPPWYKPKERPLGSLPVEKPRNDYGVELRFLRARGDDGIDIHFDVIICFPDSSDTRRIPFTKTRESWDRQTESWFWTAKLADTKLGLWCVADLLDRFVDLPQWGGQAVPLFLKGATSKNEEGVKSLIGLINAGCFDFEKWKQAKCFGLPDSKILAREHKRRAAVRGAGCSAWSLVRHSYTPYDYLWQTGKMTAEDALEYIKSAEYIKQILSELTT